MRDLVSSWEKHTVQHLAELEPLDKAPWRGCDRPQDLQAWDVSLVAQTGLQFDLRSAQGKPHPSHTASVLNPSKIP
jgi:hypothetical protein